MGDKERTAPRSNEMVNGTMGKRESDREQRQEVILGLGAQDEEELYGKKTRFDVRG